MDNRVRDPRGLTWGAVTEPRGKWTHGWRLRVGAAASVFHDRARVHTHASRTSPRAVVIAVSTVDVPGAGSGERQTVWAGWRVPANEPRRDGGRLEDDDPRPGGDGGRRERLRGGRADPTQRSRGGATAEGLPQCPVRDITHATPSRSTKVIPDTGNLLSPACRRIGHTSRAQASDTPEILRRHSFAGNRRFGTDVKGADATRPPRSGGLPP